MLIVTAGFAQFADKRFHCLIRRLQVFSPYHSERLVLVAFPVGNVIDVTAVRRTGQMWKMVGVLAASVRACRLEHHAGCAGHVRGAVGVHIMQQRWASNATVGVKQFVANYRRLHSSQTQRARPQRHEVAAT
jgi:hypothetical protein